MDKLKSFQTNFEQQIIGRDRHIQELVVNLESISREAGTLKFSLEETLSLKEEIFKREEFLQRVIGDADGLKQENANLKALIDQQRHEVSQLKTVQT